MSARQAVTSMAGACRRFCLYLGFVARGLMMGSADVVPGVSGGTVAFVLGIYEDLIAGIRMLGRPVFWRLLMKGRFREAAAVAKLPFLLAVALGITVAILTLARAVTWLLDNRPLLAWGFFFGLVLASVPVVGRRVKRWNLKLLCIAVLGTACAFYLVGAAPVQTPDALWFVFLSGVVAICAMVLPGISGAFILVLLDKYEYMLRALNDRDLVVVAVFCVGAIAGLLSFAQLLGWLFRRFHDLTVAILIGLMAGSLRKIWPWREHAGTEYETAAWPSLTVDGGLNPEIAWVLLVVAAGAAIVLLLDWYNRRVGRARERAGEEDLSSR